MLGLWVDDNISRYFTGNRKEWTEYQNDSLYAKFKFIKSDSENENVFLYTEDRKFYIQLTSSKFKWGWNLDNIGYEIGSGHWERKLQ